MAVFKSVYLILRKKDCFYGSLLNHFTFFSKNGNEDGTKKPESDIPRPDDQQKLRLHKVSQVSLMLP